MTWRAYEELRPDELAATVADRPVAYWPLGLIEHHGWHLPVGFDGIKARRICERIAVHTGGVLLPTMWWGGGGGHGGFLWTFYEDEDAAGTILATTVERLSLFGFRAIVLLAGHYPWRQIIQKHIDPIIGKLRDTTVFAGTEMEIAGDVRLPGDHAAKEETSYGLSLLAELVDLPSLVPHDPAMSWPGGVTTPDDERVNGVRYDAADPLFAQMGEDARAATAERGEHHMQTLVEKVAARVNNALQGPRA